MRQKKRELVERTFTPLDWYLQGKYDNAEFVYIAHDADAWEVDREEFFGIRSGGGTRISSAYEVAMERLEEEYPGASGTATSSPPATPRTLRTTPRSTSSR